MDNFQEYWSDLRRGLRPNAVHDSLDVVSMTVIHRWCQDTDNAHRPSFVVVSGANRERLYRRVQHDDWMFERPGTVQDLYGSRNQAWVFDGLTRHLVERVRDLEVPPEFRDKTTFMVPLPEKHTGWEVIWGLVSCSFLVTERVLDLVNKRNSLLADAHRALLEARFIVMESHDPTVAVSAIGRWVEGQKHASLTEPERAFLERAHITQAVTDSERFDVLLFLLTLARENDILGGVVLSLDALENVVEKERADELYRLIDTCDRWTSLGSPFGLVVGWRGDKDDTKNLRKLHPRLAKRIIESDRWVRASSESQVW